MVGLQTDVDIFPKINLNRFERKSGGAVGVEADVEACNDATTAGLNL